MDRDLQIEIIRHVAPLVDDEPLKLFWHKGQPWVDDIRCRMAGQREDSRDCFFVARARGRLVAHVWYTVSAADRRIGLLGHVYTHPDYRRQGVSSRLMQAALADFLDNGGVTMQLYTSNPPTVPYYEKLGFENLYSNRALHETDWYMRYPIDSQPVIDDWFAVTPCHIRTLRGGDLPKYCLLLNCEYDTRLKDWAQGVGLGLEAEYAFITSANRIAAGEGVCCVLENGQTIVGIGCLIRSGFAHQSHLAAVDCYVHRRFRSHTKELIDACLSHRTALGVEIVYAMFVDQEKESDFAAAGFTKKATLSKHYRIKDRCFDAALYQL